MELSPKFYHWLVRPKWFSKKYISTHLNSNYCFKHKYVLDFGCGIGTNCTNFTPNHYLGVDCDLKRVSYARDRHPAHHFEAIEGAHLPVSDGVVDYVVIISVIHHISRWEIVEYLSEFKRVLKPGGKVIMMEPCISENSSLRNRFMCLIDRGKYIRSQKEYMALFDQHCFKTKAVERYNQLVVYKKIIIEASPI
ncbi:MAG: class I SAM-dependent methyltransferase [Clostridia bacterium]